MTLLSSIIVDAQNSSSKISASNKLILLCKDSKLYETKNVIFHQKT